MATPEKFGILIEAIDRTRAGFASVVRGATQAGGQIGKAMTAPLRALANPSSMALVYNTQAMAQAVKRVYEGFNRIATESAKLKVVDASFANMTGRSGRAADRLAQSLKDAALGMITLGQAKEVANRALASGMSLDQLRTAMEFISKKSITTGIDAGQALQTVITGLSRGSTLFLDDFGVLVDGTAQVKRNYEAIKGVGAFDALGPAAQKAEIVRAAVADMQRQMGMIGVSGNELVFKLGRLKSTFDEIKLKAGQALLPFADALSDSLESIAGKIDSVVSSLVRSVASNYGLIRDMFSTSFRAVGTMLGSTLRSVWRTFMGSIRMNDIVSGLSTTFAKLPIYMGQGFLKMKDIVGTFLKNFLQGIGRFVGVMGLGIGNLIAFMGGAPKKGQEITDAFETAGAEIHAMGLKAEFALRVTNKEAEALKDGLRKVDELAARMKVRFAGIQLSGFMRDTWYTLRGAFANLFNGSPLVGVVKEAASQTVDSAKQAARIWQDAFRSASQAIDRATQGLKEALGERNAFVVEKLRDAMEHELARFDAHREVLQQRGFNTVGADWNRAVLQLQHLEEFKRQAAGAAFNPRLRLQMETEGLGLARELRNNPAVLRDQRLSEQVEQYFQHFRGAQEARVNRGVEEARQGVMFAQRHRQEAADQMILAARKDEVRAIADTTTSVRTLGRVALEAAGAMKGLRPGGAIGGAMEGVGMALDGLLGRIY